MYETRHCETDGKVETVTRQMYENISSKGEHPFLCDAYRKLGKTIKTPLGFTRLAIMYISLTERLYHKINQITHQNWLSKKMVEGCFVALEKHVPIDARYEHLLEVDTYAFPEHGKINICGRLDAFDDTNVFELKCVGFLTLEHKLQLLIYAWMWRETMKPTLGSRVFKLINMRSGEVLRLQTDSHLIDEALRILVDNKYRRLPEMSDKEFIGTCLDHKVVEHVVRPPSIPVFVEDD
jgi:hypothetical protein